MLAVIYGNTRIVRRLLIRGANRYVKDIQGKTPLAVAI
jgi:ankyrin repeat protein